MHPHRRVTATAGIVAVGLAVVLAVALIGPVATRQDTIRAASEPPAEENVLRGNDASTAVEGKDYEVIRQVPGRIGYQAEALLPDGAFVLRERFRVGADFESLPDRSESGTPGPATASASPALGGRRRCCT